MNQRVGNGLSEMMYSRAPGGDSVCDLAHRPCLICRGLVRGIQLKATTRRVAGGRICDLVAMQGEAPGNGDIARGIYMVLGDARNIGTGK